ncbi:maturation protein [ssRNA phage SRR5466729_3]|uniref:Maturation protein n=1 Tax=ssRNA phage SRR5466729_3 TaxID=2786446 RepID=A0A8S5L096_9VIRU|nr:maturation protein [ssRNA phage SRR5466729_3]DAD50863.1 TPA_asm: maturation protein [ssRNA phage SRR5466729_3]
MTSGSITFNRFSVNGTYRMRTWSGGNNRSQENSYDMTDVWTRNEHHERRSLSTGAIISQGFGGYGTRHDLPSYSGNAMLQLLSKLSSEIRGHDFNAGVFGGTLHQTLNTLTGSATALFGGMRALRHGDVEQALRSFSRTLSGEKLLAPGAGKTFRWRKPAALDGSELSGTLLSYRYAYEPLLNDVYEAAKYLEEKTKDSRIIKTRIRGPVEKTTLNDPVAGASYSYWTRKRVCRELRVEYVERLTTSRSLGLTNPASLAYELIPYSFIIDWFIPIGQYIEELTFFSGFDVRVHQSTLWVSEGSKSSSPCTQHNAWAREWPHDSWCCSGGLNNPVISFTGYKTVEDRKVKLERRPNQPISVPLPSLKAIEKALSITHLENALALLHGGARQAFR